MKYEELPDVLTVQELKTYLKVGTTRAYEIGKQIPHFKNGNRKLFPKERVRDWLMKQSESKTQRRLRAL